MERWKQKVEMGFSGKWNILRGNYWSLGRYHNGGTRIAFQNPAYGEVVEVSHALMHLSGPYGPFSTPAASNIPTSLT